MKKILFSLFAVLLMCGTVMAGGIPDTIDPQNGPFFGSITVFNNSGGTLSAGDTVIWDIDSSTGDNDAYVTTTTTADTGLVAGIVWPAQITDQSTGSMATWGVVQCDVAGNVVADTHLCSSTTAGEAATCTDDSEAFGHAVASGLDTLVNCFIDP